MLASLLGSLNKERILIYLAARGRGYPREIARFYDAPLSPIQNAMDRLEVARVVACRPVGAVREYQLNPAYPAGDELARLLERALSLYPKPLQDQLLITRTRPRRRGKPLRPARSPQR